MPAKREDITDEAVRRLASYGCTQEEIADFFDTSRSVITARFGQAFKLGASEVRKNIRKWQMRRAQKGSDTMLIHLGKQYCGQSDKVESKNTGEQRISFEVGDDGRNPGIPLATSPAPVLDESG